MMRDEETGELLRGRDRAMRSQLVKPEGYAATVYRIQDHEGRGPWKPGMYHRWRELDRRYHPACVDVFTDFGHWQHRVQKVEHAGTACRSLEHLRRWFTVTEYRRLLALGYRAVRIRVERVVDESAGQMIIARRSPLWANAEPVELYRVAHE